MTGTYPPLCHYFLIFFVVASLLGHTNAVAQDKDTTYIQKFPESLNLRLLAAQKGLQLQAKNSQLGENYYFNPWYRNYVGLGGFLWNIGFNFLLPVSPPLQDNNLKRFDFQGSLYAKNWLVDGIYQRYQGFVLGDNPFTPNAEPESYQHDMVLKKIQATITYLPGGEQFSLRFPFNQGDRQRKSQGSLLLSSDFSYTKLYNDDGILPEGVADEADPAGQLDELRFYSLNALVGYGATLVHRNFFLHAFGLTGLGFQRKRYYTGQEQRAFAVEPVYDIRGAFGYDKGAWYTGVYVSSDYTVVEIEQWQFIGRTSQIRLYLGIRIDEPEFLRKIKPKFLENWRNSPNIPLPPIFG
uniref:DUF4421 family protein n=1 Tax=Roseihalotalea indica TaxID=2867963 RepID=A0AA49GL55_9BACT|nr:DUF4421 family protein [Tunicatimonas sp. TK19036]